MIRSMRAVVETAGSLAMIVMAVMLLRGPTASPPPTDREASDTVRFEGAFLEGRPQAPITVAIYSDFRCPYCSQFATETLPALRERFVSVGEVRLVFRNSPIDRLHPDARRLAALALCAGWQGFFWKTHDALFATPVSSTSEIAGLVAARFGLDTDELSTCVDRPATLAVVAADLNEAHRLRIASTPTFLVGRTDRAGNVRIVDRIVGAAGIERFERAFEAARAIGP